MGRGAMPEVGAAGGGSGRGGGRWVCVCVCGEGWVGVEV